MEDQIISFETAKLAKEKEVNIKSAKAYAFRYKEHEESTYKGILTTTPLQCDIPAPTQSLLQRWLREKHSILIEPTYNTSKYAFDLVICLIGGFTIHNKDWSNTNYEQVLETGLKEALKLIK